ncbi:patatin-like phospholipase domain-containing protein [Mucilaginibacter ginsenosidivorans]|uniref:Patatin-like phospholipase family protein n=1 Tax=Mucilaginibacter ginsenosidivorans TaxID=398053 RepID=A0A5B8UWR5_9SPHI|nr:patatin-like phospholipase family protein [Mucilaginibacter ginsenosidivorans]QEC63372.1 patatin-like phospholipase family protein [Mucilaginibacter ginsenosidivorans]
MATDTTTRQDTFYVGLCMAGAVSAGAYTAGVMDYLIEALTEWERRRGQPGVPAHKVQIPVMGGASAGGMTSVMGASAMNNPLTPIDVPAADLLAEHPENKLYHSWVDLTGVDMFSTMLDTSDIKPGAVLSALNSSFIDPIAKRVVDADPAKWQPLPAFITPGLKVFTTLSNLQGFDYNIPFKSVNSTGKSKYIMAIHNDYACFQLTEGNIDGPNGGWIPLNLKNKTNTDIAAAAAMATGAFPVGLQSRIVTRDAQYVNNNQWLKGYLKQNPLTEGKYQTLNVDGGLINNEPFDKVRDVLSDVTGQDNPDDYNNFNKFQSTVLMIQPFPTSAPPIIALSTALPNVISNTLATMLKQMRAKPINLENALDDDCAGQYLITPARIVKGPDGNETELAGDLAIACGALGGFGGFINKEFRVHDYFLGRYNCKIFLRDYFTIPAENLDKNPIFAAGYANTNKDDFKSTKDNSYQIIPIFADATNYTFPDFKFSSGTNWPTLKESDIDKYRSAIKGRIQAALLNITEFNWLTRGLLWIGAKIVINGKLSDKIIGTIKSEFQKWKLLP